MTRIRLQAAVKATIVETNGFRIFKDPEQRELLRRLGMERGLLVLTDSDAAGFVIRGHLNGLLPPDRIKHAYVPAVAGREKRKTADSKEGLLGVEGMDAATLEAAIPPVGCDPAGRRGRPGGWRHHQGGFLSGRVDWRPDSGNRRQRLLEKLGFPRHLSANRLLEAVNVLMTREEYRRAVEKSPKRRRKGRFDLCATALSERAGLPKALSRAPRWPAGWSWRRCIPAAPSGRRRSPKSTGRR